jgi:hypothetical protein
MNFTTIAARVVETGHRRAAWDGSPVSQIQNEGKEKPGRSGSWQARRGVRRQGSREGAEPCQRRDNREEGRQCAMAALNLISG